MGRLDEKSFAAIVGAGCPACSSAKVEIKSFIDRRLLMMLADPNDPGRWVHDGEKFVDGTYSIACAACAKVLFETADCPRCHAEGGLARALSETSRLPIPRRCPGCNELELLALALVPATARYGSGETPKPKPLAEYGEPGHHMVAFACESCDAAVVTQKCPLCDAPGPLRARP
jgi:hypothetical protein